MRPRDTCSHSTTMNSAAYGSTIPPPRRAGGGFRQMKRSRMEEAGKTATGWLSPPAWRRTIKSPLPACGRRNRSWMLASGATIEGYTECVRQKPAAPEQQSSYPRLALSVLHLSLSCNFRFCPNSVQRLSRGCPELSTGPATKRDTVRQNETDFEKTLPPQMVFPQMESVGCGRTALGEARGFSPSTYQICRSISRSLKSYAARGSVCTRIAPIVESGSAFHKFRCMSR